MTNPAQVSVESAQYVRRHLCFGWWSLLTFVCLGIILESLLAFKITAYTGGSGEAYESIRRLMWRLAHAHGTLLSLVHLLFAMTIHLEPATIAHRGARFASRCFMGASFLLPGGFFLGGIFIFEKTADPGIGIFLAPVGAFLMLTAVFLTARGVLAAKRPTGAVDGTAETESAATTED